MRPELLSYLGINEQDLLGQGSESWLFALDTDRIARINRHGATQIQVEKRNGLLAELGRYADRVPFAIPQVLDTELIAGCIITIERRLPGRPLNQVLSEHTGEQRASLIRQYLEAAAQIGDLPINRPWFGDLIHPKAIHTNSFRSYLEARAQSSLISAGKDYQNIDPAQLAEALPEPNEPSLVHLDAFPENMLADDGRITAVLDFGQSAIMGDRRLDPLTAAAYLAPEITLESTDFDQFAAKEWLMAQGLFHFYQAVENWIASYWSFALDDIRVWRWTQRILLK